MTSFLKYSLSGWVIGAVVCGGCAGSTSHRQPAASLPQWVRFFNVQQMWLKSGALFISGKASAAADGGKNTFTATSPLSSYPLVRVTIKSANTSELESCRQRVESAQENRQSIDIRGLGIFTIESTIDPPLETGVFTLTKLDACGGAPASTHASPGAPSTFTSSTGQAAISAADLVAVPERYLDRNTVISGRMDAPVHFADPVSRLMIQSEGQSLRAYFPTAALAAESRLALVHAAPGSILILEGTLTRITPKSLAAQSADSTAMGYEFDVSKVVSVAPAPQ